MPINLSQKQNCNNCRALSYSMYSSNCELGVSIEASKRWHGVAVTHKPLSPCYKPTTVKSFMELLEMKQKGQLR